MVTCCLFIFINVICRLGGPYREKLWPTEVLKMLSEAAGQRQHFQASKNWIEFTYGDFPCHLKVNRDKLALISCLWKCENCERLTITANSFTKIDRLDGFRPLRRSGWENSARFRNQSDSRICWIRSRTEKRIKYQVCCKSLVHIDCGKSTMYIQIHRNKNLGIC